jgi:hypothetical protein
MTNIVNLIKQWEASAGARLSMREYGVRLPLGDAARIAALSEMYPRRSEVELITDLLTAALDELEVAMTYLPVKQTMTEDEVGNLVIQDLGPTPRFLELSRKYRSAMESAIGLDKLAKA